MHQEGTGKSASPQEKRRANAGDTQPENSHRAGATRAWSAGACPPRFPTIHNPLTASPSFHISDLALALKHFRQACLIESSNTMGLPGEPQPQKPLLSGRTTSASLTVLPNKRSRESQRALGLQHCENTHDLRTLPQPQKEKQGTKSHHLPTSPGRKAFTSRHCHLYKPPSASSKSPKAFVLYPATETRGGELIAS